jgi:hypothetical protein
METIRSEIYVLYRIVGRQLVEAGRTHVVEDARDWHAQPGQVAGVLPGGPYPVVL